MKALRVSDITEEHLLELRRDGIVSAWKLDTQKHNKSYGTDASIWNINQTVSLYDKQGRTHTGNTSDFIVVNNGNIVVLSHETYYTLFPSES